MLDDCDRAPRDSELTTTLDNRLDARLDNRLDARLDNIVSPLVRALFLSNPRQLNPGAWHRE